MSRTKIDDKMFRRMDLAEAVEFSQDARKLMSIEAPPHITWGAVSRLEGAIEVRGRHGFFVDPTSRTEVKGIVRSALAGNDHLRPLFNAMGRYTIGATQVYEATGSLELIREAME